jgi:alpha-mannosidase
VTLSSADCCFFRLGESTPGRLDTETPRLRVLAGGQVDGPGLGIPGQDGDERFLQRFALRAHGRYDEAAAMRFALEHQNPPVAAWVGDGGEDLPPDAFSLVRLADPDVLLWALKPAEDDPASGVVARLWNLGSKPAPAGLCWRGGELAGVERVTDIETPEGPATLRDGVVTDRLAPHGMSSFLLTTGR